MSDGGEPINQLSSPMSDGGEPINQLRSPMSGFIGSPPSDIGDLS
jgi:hypothetical protein